MKGNIAVAEPNNARRSKSVAFKNNAPFINCISKINNKLTDNVMSMYNLLEHSKNYRKATGSLWNCYWDDPSNLLSSNSESFKYRTSIT